MIQYYRIKEKWVVYNTEAPDIRGIGNTIDEALCDLRDKINAILETITKLQKELNSKSC